MLGRGEHTFGIIDEMGQVIAIQFGQQAAVAKLGIRDRFKSCCPKGRVGSIPTRRTSPPGTP